MYQPVAEMILPVRASNFHKQSRNSLGCFLLQRDEKHCETAQGIALKSYINFTEGSAKLP